MGRVLVAITGASGTIYGVRLVQRLVELAIESDVVVSPAGTKVLAIEHSLPPDPAEWFEAGQPGPRPRRLDPQDITAASASGSSAPEAMLIIPCSMGTIGRLAAGVASSLIERSADVMLKERRPLVLVPRETPLSTLHLRNLLSLSEVGAHIVPAMPGFYHHPRDLEDMIAFLVDRALQAAHLDVPLRHRWRDSGGGPA